MKDWKTVIKVSVFYMINRIHAKSSSKPQGSREHVLGHKLVATFMSFCRTPTCSPNVLFRPYSIDVFEICRFFWKTGLLLIKDAGKNIGGLFPVEEANGTFVFGGYEGMTCLLR